MLRRRAIYELHLIEVNEKKKKRNSNLSSTDCDAISRHLISYYTFLHVLAINSKLEINKMSK